MVRLWQKWASATGVVNGTFQPSPLSVTQRESNIAQTKSARLAKASSHGRCGVNPGEIIQFCRYSLGAGKIGVGRVAEWFKAPVLKSSFDRATSFCSVLFCLILFAHSTVSIRCHIALAYPVLLRPVAIPVAISPSRFLSALRFPPLLRD
jgi:hypothetical protein